MLYILGQYPPPLSPCKISKVPDGHVIHWWQVEVRLAGKEPVDLALVGELGGEGRCSHLARLRGDLLSLISHAVDLVVNSKIIKFIILDIFIRFQRF